MQNILIIEDEIVIRSALKQFLEKQKYTVCEAGSIEDAVKFSLSDLSLIITDLRLPGPPGTDILKFAGDVPVLVMTSYASLRSAVETMQLGAVDYIAKPFDYDEILETIQKTIKKRPPEPSSASIQGMIGASESMRNLFEQIKKVAPTYTNVLIEGESGTGKELVAKALHHLSQHADLEMVTLNCASIPDTHIEPELFGYEDNGNPGRVGLIEAADGSTLFLDEIGELPLEVQSQLLCILQEGYIRRIGAERKRKVNIRLVASTQQDLIQLSAEGKFRADLYYHINVVKFRLPPLRERKDDLVELAMRFLDHNCRKLNKPDIKFSQASIQLLSEYSWPGNIRELQNTIERAVILCDQGEITPHLLSINPCEDSSCPNTRLIPMGRSLEDYFHKFVLENQNYMTETQLAGQLGISRKSLWEKRQKLNIPRVKSRKK